MKKINVFSALGVEIEDVLQWRLYDHYAGLPKKLCKCRWSGEVFPCKDYNECDYFEEVEETG